MIIPDSKKDIGADPRSVEWLAIAAPEMIECKPLVRAALFTDLASRFRMNDDSEHQISASAPLEL